MKTIEPKTEKTPPTDEEVSMAREIISERSRWEALQYHNTLFECEHCGHTDLVRNMTLRYNQDYDRINDSFDDYNYRVVCECGEETPVSREQKFKYRFREEVNMGSRKEIMSKTFREVSKKFHKATRP
jgi:hypothetical protein